MKKFFALLLVALLVLGMSATAFATDASNNGLDPSTAKTVNLEKIFTVNTKKLGEGQTAPKLSETLTFTSEPDAGNPEGDPNLTISDLTITETGTYPIVVNIPSYENVGKYTYTITENAGTTQGVTYDNTPITFIVQIGYDYENGCLYVVEANPKDTKAEGATESVKDDEFDNNFDVGGTPEDEYTGLTVKKTVDGNLGDRNKLFTISVTLTAEKTVKSEITVSGGSGTNNSQTITAPWTGSKTVEIELKHNEIASFKNIPAGVTYTVVEAETHTTGDVNSEEGYTATYEKASGPIEAGKTAAAIVKNEKKTEILTGVILQYAPYIAILAVVLVGAILMIIRRRRSNED